MSEASRKARRFNDVASSSRGPANTTIRAL